jgi:hypothetical protein
MRNTLLVMIILYLSCLGSASAEKNNKPSCPASHLKIPRGLQIQANLGTSFWTGYVADYSKPGVGLAVITSYEFFDWLAAFASWHSGIHSTDQPYPPAQSSFSTNALHLGARLSIELGSFDLFAKGGAGGLWSEPNILVRIKNFPQEMDISWLGGIGFIWHTPRRHFWIGAEASAMGVSGFDQSWIMVSASIGITI